MISKVMGYKEFKSMKQTSCFISIGDMRHIDEVYIPKNSCLATLVGFDGYVTNE